jgi:hypothetical protein
MEKNEIKALLMMKLIEVWPVAYVEPEDPDIIKGMGQLELCIDLLNTIYPGWSKGTKYEEYAREEGQA